MPINTQRAISVEQVSADPVEFITTPMNSTWAGMPYKWRVELSVSPLPNSGATASWDYNGNNIVVGDWLTTSPQGIAVQIIEIEDQTEASITAIVEDIDLYNTLNDSTQSGSGIGPNGIGYVFPLDDVSGLPILGPVSSYSVDINTQMDLFARFIQQKQLKGGSGSNNALRSFMHTSNALDPDEYEDFTFPTGFKCILVSATVSNECTLECHSTSNRDDENPYRFKGIPSHLTDDGSYVVDSVRFGGDRFINLVSLDGATNTHWRIVNSSLTSRSFIVTVTVI